MTWPIALIVLGVLVIVISLTSNTPGGVNVGGLGAIFIGAPLLFAGLIWLALHLL
jgi:hypothetical protein